MASYIGSENILTSSANQELVPEKPSYWTLGYRLRKLSFYNYQDCHVSINNSTPIFIEAGQGFESYEGISISSFIIVEPNIQYKWLGVL